MGMPNKDNIVITLRSKHARAKRLNYMGDNEYSGNVRDGHFQMTLTTFIQRQMEQRWLFYLKTLIFYHLIKNNDLIYLANKNPTPFDINCLTRPPSWLMTNLREKLRRSAVKHIKVHLHDTFLTGSFSRCLISVPCTSRQRAGASGMDDPSKPSLNFAADQHRRTCSINSLPIYRDDGASIS